MASVKVWDLAVRSIHWALVLAFTLNYFILEPGGDIHEIVGYSAAALVFARIIWGFTGPTNARFASFIRGPKAVLAHLREIKEQPPLEHGHNPAAGWMILLLLGLVLALATSGFLLQEVDAFWGNSTLEWVHGLLADTLYALVLVHIIAAVAFSLLWRTNLIATMITGRRKH